MNFDIFLFIMDFICKVICVNLTAKILHAKYIHAKARNSQISSESEQNEILSKWTNV